jgi:hypothetical protein
MRNFLSSGVLVLSTLVAGTNAQAQQWCAYSSVHDTQLNCGYSTEHACAKVSKDAACTLDPFYD